LGHRAEDSKLRTEDIEFGMGIAEGGKLRFRILGCVPFKRHISELYYHDLNALWVAAYKQA